MKVMKKSIGYILYFTATIVLFVGGVGIAAAQEGNAENGEKVFKTCSACHKVGDKAKNSVGPVLNGVFGRVAGSFEDYKYGSGLKAANEMGLVWDEETMFGWIADPRGYIREYLGDKKAKAKMTFKLKDEQKRRDVIAYLKTLSPDAE